MLSRAVLTLAALLVDFPICPLQCLLMPVTKPPKSYVIVPQTTTSFDPVSTRT